jgi:2-methylcitrate dehydratase PrpD
MEITKTIADFVADITFDAIPDHVKKMTVNLIMDTLGCMYAGSTADGIEEIVDYLSVFDSGKQASVFGFDKMLSVHNAALVNSAAAHARDYDDTHDEAVNHASVTTLPPLIALSQFLSSSAAGATSGIRPITGKEFITAFCAALEVANRVSLAFIPYLSVGWLPTTLSGPFGSACGIAKLLKLPTEAVQKSIGFAYAQIHGNRQALVEGTLAKRIQPAFSAVAGIHAAYMAKANLSSPKEVFTGVFGLSNLYTQGQIDVKRLVDNLGSEWETGKISIKPYPSCRCTHPVIDAALELSMKHKIDYRDIASGHIQLPPASMGQIGQQFSIGSNPTVDAQFNAQYTAALSFVKGKPEISDFEGTNIINRSEIIALAHQFTITEFDKSNRGLSPIEMQIELSSGKVCDIRIEHVTGSENKPVSRELLIEKFRENLNMTSLSTGEIDRILQLLLSISDSEDVGDVFGLIQKESGI